MPNNDLGTARGKVRVEYSSKGEKQLNDAMSKMEGHLKKLEDQTKSLDAKLSKLDSNLGHTSGSFSGASGSSDKFNRSMGSGVGAISKMIVQLSAMNKSLTSIDKSLKSSETRFDRQEKELIRNTRAAAGFTSSIFDAHKGLVAFGKDSKEVAEDIQGLIRVVNNATSAWDKYGQAVRILNQAGSYQMGGGQNRQVLKSLTIALADMNEKTRDSVRIFAQSQRNVLGWVGATGKLEGSRSIITLLGASMVELKDKLTGVNRSINLSPNWVKKIVGVSASLGALSTGMAQVAKRANLLGNLDKLPGSKPFDLMTRGAQGLSGQLAKLQPQIEKTFGPGAAATFAKMNRNIKDSDTTFARFFRTIARDSDKFGITFDRNAQSLGAFTQRATEFAKGLAMMTGGLKSLYNRFQWFFKLPKGVMAGLAIFFARVLPSALHATGQALTFVSNLVAGLWSGIKQLGGGLTVLPGLLAGIGAVVTSLIPVFAGLKDKFKDVFSDDPVKSMQAYLKLPAQLRPIANAIDGQKKAWKDLQNNLQTTAFRGAQNDIKALGGTYFPLLQRSMTPVVLAFRNAKDALVDFALEGQTQKDVGEIYRNTAQVFKNLAEAIRPALDGLRDMAAVGSDFLKDQSVWAGELSKRFAEWARLNRENGNLMRWMVEAKQGAFDLAKGLWEGTKALYKILTLFQSAPQDNYLQTFADSMVKFNKAVDKSKSVGVLAKIRNVIQTMGADKLDDVKELMHTFGDAIKRIAPFINELSKAFSDVFISSMQRATQVVTLFLKALNELGITKALGWLAGFTAGFVLLPKYLATATDAFKTFWGVFLVLKNRQKVVKGLSDAIAFLSLRLENLGPVGRRAAAGLDNINQASGSLLNKIGAFASVASVAAVALLAIFAVVKSGNDGLKEFGETLDKGADQSTNFKKNLQSAFLDDQGLAGSNVLTALTARTDEFLQHLRDLEDQTPGISQHLGDFFEDFAGYLNPGKWFVDPFSKIKPEDDIFVDDPTINRYQELGDNAKRASAELGVLVQEGTDLNAMIQASDPIFNQQIQNLQDQGKISQETAVMLREQHDAYKAIERDMIALGPAGVKAANAFDMISTAAGDAGQKLDGLKMLLEALGFLEVDAQEAATDYANSIRDLSENVRQAIEDGDGLNNIFDAQGKLNVNNSQTAANLAGVFGQLSDQFLRTATSGNSVDDAMAMIEGQLPGIAKQLNVTTDELKEFIRTHEGFVPEPIKIAVQLEGKDRLTNGLGQLLVSLQAAAEGKPVEFPIKLKGVTEQDMKNLDQDIEKQLGQDILDVDGTNIRFKGGVKPTPALLQKLVDFLNNHGVDTVGSKADPNSVPTITPRVKPPPSGDIDRAFSPVEEALAKLDVEAKEAADAIKGSADQFEEFLKMLAEKKASQGLIDTLKQMREGFEHGGKQAKDMADAIRDFSDATIDADTRAKNFISSLQNYGKLPDDSALAKYNQDVDDAIGYQSDFVDMLDKTGAGLVLNNGRLDQNSKNGQKLSETISQLRQDSLALVAQGDATPEEAYTETTDVLRNLLAKYDITDPGLQQQVIDTYFPKETFQTGIEQAMQSADPKSVMENIFHDDPAKLDSVVNMLDSEEEILKKIVGPDGKIIIPLQGAGPGEPGGPDTVHIGDALNPSQAAPPALPLPPPVAPKAPLPLPKPSGPPPPPPVDETINKVKTITDDELRKIFKENPELDKTLAPYTEEAVEQGKTFAEAYAEGIREGSPEVKAAIERLAELAGDGVGRSPAKYGPLSGRGWTLYRGQSFTKAWATGISSEAGAVKGSVTGIAGEATGAMYASGGADQTPFLGQLKELMDFFQHLADVAEKISEIGLRFATLANTMSGNRLFPKSYVRDPNADRRRGNPLGPFNPKGSSSNTRMANGSAVGDYTGKDVELAAELKRQGFTDSQIVGLVALNSVETGNWSHPESTMGFTNRQAASDVGSRVTAFKEMWNRRQKTGAVATAGDPETGLDAAGNVVDPGKYANWLLKLEGYSATTDAAGNKYPVGQFMSSDKYAQSIIDAFSSARTTGGGAGSIPVVGGRGKLRKGEGVEAGLAPAAQDVAAILSAIFPGITDIGGRQNRTGPQMHPKGRAIDVMTGQNAAIGDAIAAFVKQNYAALGIQSFIWRDKGLNLVANEGGGPGTTYGAGGHGGPSGTDPGSHVHIQFADGATIDTSRLGTVVDLPQNAPVVKPPTVVQPPAAPPPKPAPADNDPLIWAQIPGMTNPTQVKQSVAERFGYTIVPAPNAPPPPAGGPKKPLPGFSINPDEYEVVKPGTKNVPKGWRAVAQKGLLGEPDTMFLVPDNASMLETFTGKTPPSPAGWEWKTNDANWVKLGGKPTDFVLSPTAGGPPAPAAPSTEVPHIPGTTPATPGPTPVTLPDDTTQSITDIADNTSDMPQALKDIGAPDPRSIKTEEQAVSALQQIDSVIADQQQQGKDQTPQGKQTIDALNQMHSNIQQQFGLQEGPNAIDQISSVVSGISGIASDIFQVINSSLEAVAATKDIGDTLVRGIENTEDVSKLIDDFQKYIALAADVAGATSSILGFAGSLVGAGAAGDPSGGAAGASMALQAASQIAAMIQAALETVNAVIDLAQEAYHIIGSYVGDFLGYLVGGPGGLQGDVKFLLDEAAGKLYAYGSENPMAKTGHNVPGVIPGPEFRQGIGNINVYGGPGTDPRDDTRQMIFQVKAAQMTGAIGQ